jgi:hypothetical protein
VIKEVKNNDNIYKIYNINKDDFLKTSGNSGVENIITE